VRLEALSTEVSAVGDDEIRAEQKTFRHELIREEPPDGFRNLKAKGQDLRENPFKSPPNNLTTRRGKR